MLGFWKNWGWTHDHSVMRQRCRLFSHRQGPRWSNGNLKMAGISNCCKISFSSCVFLHRGNCQFLDETSPLISVSCWHEKLFETFLTFKSLFRKIDRRKKQRKQNFATKTPKRKSFENADNRRFNWILKKQIRQGGNVLASGASTPGRKNELPERQPAYPCTFPDSEKEAPKTLQLFICNGRIFNWSGLLSVPR